MDQRNQLRAGYAAQHFIDRATGKTFPLPAGFDYQDTAPFSGQTTGAMFTHLQLDPYPISWPQVQELAALETPEPDDQHLPTWLELLTTTVKDRLDRKLGDVVAYILQEHYQLDPLELATSGRIFRVCLSHQPQATHLLLDYKTPDNPGRWICTIRERMGIVPVTSSGPGIGAHFKAQFVVEAPILLPDTDELPAFNFPNHARP